MPAATVVPRPVVARAMGLAEWGMLVLLGLIWGGSFFFARIAVSELSPLSVVAGRIIIAAVALSLLLALRGERLPADPGRWRVLLVMAGLNNIIPFTLIYMGQTQIGAGLAAILNATTPLFTVLVAQVATDDERMTPWRTLGVLMGLAGVAVMLGPSALAGSDDTWAQLAIIGAAFSYGLAAVWGRKLRGWPPLVNATGQFTASTLIISPVLLFVDRPWTRPPPGSDVVMALVALGLLSTALGYILYFTILGRAGATNVTLVTLLVPPSALLLGALFLGEIISGRELAGLAIIALGLIAIDGRLAYWLAHRRHRATPAEEPARSLPSRRP